MMWIVQELNIGIIVEIDENAHETNEPKCEIARMSRLIDSVSKASKSTILGIVFIRVAIYESRDIEALVAETAWLLESIIARQSVVGICAGTPVVIYVNYQKSSAGFAHMFEAEKASDGLISYKCERGVISKLNAKD